MSQRWSRLLSAATASYGGYALVKPDHLWKALEADRSDRDGLELLAQSFGVRDLAISAVALKARSPKVVRAAMLLRIAMDLGDAALLSSRVDDPQVRTKVLAVTLGWASLNATAVALDSRGD